MWPETTGSALLDAAQRTLAEDVLPGLSGKARFAALLVGSAVRMAAREIEQEAVIAATSAAVAEVAAKAGCGTAAALVEAIRHGAFDADRALHAGLWAHAAARTSVSKPSALTRVERGVAGIGEPPVP